MDNFEWTRGCRKRLEMIHVDYQTLERTLKTSAHWYSKVILGNTIIEKRILVNGE